LVEIARALVERGWRPGIVSRGYGALASQPRMVRIDDAARDVGDEPLLIARAAAVPVAVAGRRVAAARLLRQRHPECNVIIADDGLQHWPLARDMEIALLHYRGLGNGGCCPPAHCASRAAGSIMSTQSLPTATFRGRTRAAPDADSRRRRARLRDPALRTDLATLAREQRLHGWRLTAAAGIGMPDRFFAMLREAGLAIDAMPLADHFDYSENPFSAVTAERILVTEKDAVKCAANASLAKDPRIWVVPLATEIDPRLVDAVVAPESNLASGAAVDHRLLDILVCPICKGRWTTAGLEGTHVPRGCARLPDSRRHPSDARIGSPQMQPSSGAELARHA
jgi:tetraacyldisaccharide 4'-kinase